MRREQGGCYAPPMKLRDVEAKVLAAVGLRGDATVRELAAITKLPAYSCRRALDSLFKRSALIRRVVIDPARLGYRIYGVWFSIHPRANKIRRQLLSHLISSPNIGYVGEYEGDYNYKIDIYGRSIDAVHAVLGGITQTFGPVFARRSLCCTLSLGDYALKFLAPQQAGQESVSIGAGGETVQIDAIDHVVLRELSMHVQESNRAIAQRAGVPAATLEYRIKRLRAEKVIVGFHVLPEVEASQHLGLFLHLHRIRLSRLDDATRRRIDQFAAADPAVHGFTHSIGEIDLELCSATDSSRAEREFSSRLEEALGDVIADHAAVSILKHHKINTYPFAPLKKGQTRPE